MTQAPPALPLPGRPRAHCGRTLPVGALALLLGCGDDGAGPTSGSTADTTSSTSDPTQASAAASETPTTGDPTDVPTSTAASEPGTTGAAETTAAAPGSDADTSEPTGDDDGTTASSTTGSTGAVSSASEADTGSTDPGSSTLVGEGCTPGASEACYSGPAGTEGIGACAAGSRTCDARGQFGPCVGEVLPTVETCADRGDVDCDGAATGCTGGGLWARGFGGTYDQTGWEIASDAAGRIAVVGSMAGSIDFGGGPRTPAGKTNTFLGVLDPDGEHLWSHAFGFSATNGTNLYVSDVEFDGAGNLYMAGQFNGSVDFGTGKVYAGYGLADIYLVKFDPAGKALWSRVWGDGGGEWVAELAIGPDDGPVLCGSFRQQIAFGGISLFGVGDLDDIYVASLDGDGAPKWARRFGDGKYQYCRGVAVDATGEVVVVADVQGAADFGGDLLMSAGISDLALARFDADGEHLWSVMHGNSDPQLVHAMAMDSAGAVIVSGHSYGPIDLGGGVIDSGNQADIFLAKYDADGALEWAKLHARSDGSQVLHDLAVDSADHIVTAGYFTGTFELGGPDLVSPLSDHDAFAAKFAPNGEHVWTQTHPDADEKLLFQLGRGVAIDPQDHVLLTGVFGGSITIAGEDLITNEPDMYGDVYVAKLAP